MPSQQIETLHRRISAEIDRLGEEDLENGSSLLQDVERELIELLSEWGYNIDNIGDILDALYDAASVPLYKAAIDVCRDFGDIFV
jgi:hypothetical protein